MVKFEIAAVQEILEIGDHVLITIAGLVDSSVNFEGYDEIKMVDKGNDKKADARKNFCKNLINISFRKNVRNL